MMRTGIFVIWLTILSSAAIVWADIIAGIGNAGIPPATGCHSCHHTYSINNSSGEFTITASDSTYSPGQEIQFHVSLSRPGMKVWGFQAVAVRTGIGGGGGYGGGSGVDPLLGVMESNSEFVEVATNYQLSKNPYVRNTIQGSYPGTLDSVPGWDFSWKAPNMTPGGTMYIYASGVASDRTGSVAYDYSFTAGLTIPYEPPANCCNGKVGNVDCDPEDNVDIADLTALVDHMFVSFDPLCCYKESFLDYNAWVDIADLTIMVDHLFLTFTPMQDCF